MTTHLDLNFNLLPGEEIFLAGISILRGLPEEVEALVSSLPETLDRARSSVMFAESSSHSEDPWRNAAYLRASLGEFCSMEDVLAREMKDRTRSLRIENSFNPLLHLMKLIRNFNFHVASSSTSREEVGAKWRDQQFGLPVSLITDLSVDSLLPTRKHRLYSADDVGRMVSWFNASQQHWGAGHVVCLAVEAYCREIASHCLNRSDAALFINSKAPNPRPEPDVTAGAVPHG